jgi:formylglycine-generating enzyme required for sulfatase activity
LYECLTGRPPFDGPKHVVLVSVLSDEPVPPSRREAKVPRDLETICLKCLRKEPEQRYASAEELANDLRRFQGGEPIRARPAGALEQAVKWVRRNKVVASLLTAVALVLVGGIAVSSYFAWDASSKEQVTRQEAAKATRARDFLVSIFEKAETDVKGGNVTIRQLLEEAETRIPVEFADQPELRGELVAAIARAKRGIARRTPQAMILEVRGSVQLQSAAGMKKTVAPQVLVNLDDRLTLGADAQIQLVFLSDLHKERLKPGRQVTIDFKGCAPADAVRERDDSILMTFVWLPPGTFYMGGNRSGGGIKTDIDEDFEIAVHDVTQGQWQAVMGNNPSWFSRKGNGRNSVVDISDEELKLFPVESVSWMDVQEFIKKLNEKERGRGYLYRLPTEAEWEYACRGGATSAEECRYDFYFDRPTNDLSPEQANFCDINPLFRDFMGFNNLPLDKALKWKYLQRPSRVGAYPPNKLGLCDMHGNVYQWTTPSKLPDKAVRGGSWDSPDTSCRAASRGPAPLTSLQSNIGFRLVRVPDW